MWLKRLEIKGFKRLAWTFDFSEGLTLVVGLNESGKSSLHEAFVRSLYGFSTPEQRKSLGVSAKDRRRPWDSAHPYGLVATIDEHDGRSLRIEWDFEAHTVSVYDAVTGGRVGAEPPGPSLLSLGLDDFRQVCCLSQDQVIAVSGTETLKNALEQSIMSAGGNVRAGQADDRMKEFLQGLGVRVDTYNATAAGRLNGLQTRAADLQTRIADAEAEQLAIAALAQELAAEREELGTLTIEERSLQRELLRANAETLEARLDEAQRHIGPAAARPAKPLVLPASAVGRIVTQEAAYDALVAPIQRLAEQVKGVEAKVATLGGIERAAQAAVDGLSAYAATDPRPEATVRARWAELDGLDRPLPPVPPAESAPTGPSTGSIWGQAKHILWLVLAVLTLSLAARIRNWFREWRLRSAQQAVEAALEQQTRATAIRRDDLQQEIVDALDKANAPTAALDQRVAAYLTACEKHGQLVAKQLELAQATADLKSARAPEADLRTRSQESDDLRAELLDLYEELGVSGLQFEAARAEADTRRAQAANDAAGVAAADAAQQALDAALAGSKIQSLEAEAGASRKAYDAHEAVHGPLPAPTAGLDINQVRADAQAAHSRTVQLETQIDARERAFPQPAELREELEACTADVARIEQAAAAIKIARETLVASAAATYKQFAPHLNAALEANLPRITDGRYRSATVDDNLDINVIAPETGDQISVEELSRATKDQIFLVQRLEIAHLLDPTTGSAPLLLDDPFAHFDPVRLRLGLEVVGEAATHRQVVLFSEDNALIEVVQSVCGACAVIELPAPTERLQP
jgi:DNA repair exonuclease SbcCD ATPase subunit